MAILMELVFRAVFEYLLIIPGSLIKWIYFKIRRKNKTFEACLKSNIGLNYGLGLVLLTILVLGAKVV